MLPTHVSFTNKRPIRRYRDATTPPKKIYNALLTRSRLTNLAVVLLASLCALSLLFNLRAWYFTTAVPVAGTYSASGLLATIPGRHSLHDVNHLIMVPGHAIWTGSNAQSRLNEEEWILEPYQRGGERVAALFAHISSGVELALKDERSLLIFSGGQTRPSSTTTEAESYLRLALSADLFQTAGSSFARVTTENYALDSFQNLLFSIARFREYTSRFPERITVVGYEFKRARFSDLHRVALRWPARKFEYIGVNPGTQREQDAETGEWRNGYLPYSRDIYGCHSALLHKRQQRNIFSRYHSYYTSSPELRPLFDWCPGNAEGGQDTLFEGSLPWVPS